MQSAVFSNSLAAAVASTEKSKVKVKVKTVKVGVARKRIPSALNLLARKAFIL